MIYLDESGDLGFDFNLAKTSRYLIMTCLICPTADSVQAVKRATRLATKNKLAATTPEIKGSNTSLTTKKYFFNQIQKNKDWRVMAIAADKQAWLKYHSKSATINKNLFYDDVAERLLSQVDLSINNSHIQLVVDKSKTQSALNDFDQRISSMIRAFVPEKTLLSIYHRHSFADPGLQATNLFGWGVYRKYQYDDMLWYEIYKERIAIEMKFKF